MTAIELREKAKVQTKFTAYYFTEAEMQAFIDQLCLEQRENCFEAFHLRKPKGNEPSLILNAKQP